MYFSWLGWPFSSSPASCPERLSCWHGKPDKARGMAAGCFCFGAWLWTVDVARMEIKNDPKKTWMQHANYTIWLKTRLLGECFQPANPTKQVTHYEIPFRLLFGTAWRISSGSCVGSLWALGSSESLSLRAGQLDCMPWEGWWKKMNGTSTKNGSIWRQASKFLKGISEHWTPQNRMVYHHFSNGNCHFKYPQFLNPYDKPRDRYHKVNGQKKT